MVGSLGLFFFEAVARGLRLFCIILRFVIIYSVGRLVGDRRGSDSSESLAAQSFSNVYCVAHKSALAIPNRW